MKRNRVFVSGAVFAAAWLSTGTGILMAQSPSGKSGTEAIHPDPTGPRSGSRSERTGESDVPLPQGSPESGTVEKGTSGKAPAGVAQQQGQPGEKINPSPRSSAGGSQSERTRETGVPLPQGSPHAGTVEKGMGSAAGSHASATNVRAAQQALKDKGYDPGPIDGKMGMRTKEAIKAFQNASNIEATGTLDSKTAQQLGISSSDPVSSTRDTVKSGGSMKSNGSTVKGKDTDQPNLPPSNK